MSKLVRIICLIMALAMIVTVSACKKDEGEETTTTEGTTAEGTTTEGTTTSSDPYAEHLEISFMGGNAADPAIMDANKLVQLTLEEMFNITLTFSPCPYYNQPNEFNLIVTAGALPDCGFTELTVKAPEMSTKGVIRDILKADVERLMPNYTAVLANRPLMAAWQTKSEEAYFGIYVIQSINWDCGFNTTVRLDWMENLGIEPKGNVTRVIPDSSVLTDYTAAEDNDADARLFITDYQYEYSEFVDLLDEFVHSDPDGNGADDTYGLSTDILQFMDGYYSFHIFPVAGMGFRWVQEADGSAAPQIYSVVYKEFLEMHKALADEGLLIPQYWLAEYSDVWQYWAAGMTGAVAQVTGYTGGSGTPPYSVLYANTDAKALMIPPNQGAYILNSGFMGGTDIGYLFVNAACTDAEYERILAMYDYMYFSAEGREFCKYGIEGQNFSKDDSSGTTVYTMLDQTGLAPEEAVAQDSYCVGFYYWDLAPYSTTSRGGILSQYCHDNWPVSSGYYVFYGPGSADALAACEFSAVDYATAIDPLYREYVIAVCEGTSDADTAYEQFMSAMNGMGYQEYLQAINDSMYITSELLVGSFVHPND